MRGRLRCAESGRRGCSRGSVHRGGALAADGADGSLFLLQQLQLALRLPARGGGGGGLGLRLRSGQLSLGGRARAGRDAEPAAGAVVVVAVLAVVVTIIDSSLLAVLAAELDVGVALAARSGGGRGLGLLARGFCGVEVGLHLGQQLEVHAVLADVVAHAHHHRVRAQRHSLLAGRRGAGGGAQRGRGFAHAAGEAGHVKPLVLGAVLVDVEVLVLEQLREALVGQQRRAGLPVAGRARRLLLADRVAGRGLGAGAGHERLGEVAVDVGQRGRSRDAVACRVVELLGRLLADVLVVRGPCRGVPGGGRSRGRAVALRDGACDGGLGAAQRDGLDLRIESHVHEEAVHNGAEQVGPDEMRQPPLVELLARDELVVVVHGRLGRLLQLLSEALEMRAPIGHGTERGDVEDLHARRGAGGKHEPGARDDGDVVDVRGRLDCRVRRARLRVPELEHLGVGRHELARRLEKLERVYGQPVAVVLDHQRRAGADVVQHDVARRCADAHGETVVGEADRVHGELVRRGVAERARDGRVRGEDRGRKVEHGGARPVARVPALDAAGVAAAEGQDRVHGVGADDVDRVQPRLQRRHK